MDQAVKNAVPILPKSAATSTNAGTGSRSSGSNAATRPMVSTWNIRTGQVLPERHKRKPTEEQAEETRRLRGSGGACADCRKTKKRVGALCFLWKPGV